MINRTISANAVHAVLQILKIAARNVHALYLFINKSALGGEHFILKIAYVLIGKCASVRININRAHFMLCNGTDMDLLQHHGRQQIW